MGYILSQKLDDYIERHTSQVDDVLHDLDRETHLNFTLPQMLSGHVQGKFLEMISHMMKPSRILEIGTFTGYAAICMARGMAKGGLLTTIDINRELETTVRKYVERAGLKESIDLRIGDAGEIIEGLEDQFDLVFIDADKTNYSKYYDLVFPKVRIGGYIMADNVLWSGKVIDDRNDKDTLALVNYAGKVHKDERVENVMVSIRDGILMARKLKD